MLSHISESRMFKPSSLVFAALKLAVPFFWSQPKKVSKFLAQLSIRLVADESRLRRSLLLQSAHILFSEKLY